MPIQKRKEVFSMGQYLSGLRVFCIEGRKVLQREQHACCCDESTYGGKGRIYDVYAAPESRF